VIARIVAASVLSIAAGAWVCRAATLTSAAGQISTMIVQNKKFPRRAAPGIKSGTRAPAPPLVIRLDPITAEVGTKEDARLDDTYGELKNAVFEAWHRRGTDRDLQFIPLGLSQLSLTDERRNAAAVDPGGPTAPMSARAEYLVATTYTMAGARAKVTADLTLIQSGRLLYTVRDSIDPGADDALAMFAERLVDQLLKEARIKSTPPPAYRVSFCRFVAEIHEGASPSVDLERVRDELIRDLDRVGLYRVTIEHSEPNCSEQATGATGAKGRFQIIFRVTLSLSEGQAILSIRAGNICVHQPCREAKELLDEQVRGDLVRKLSSDMVRLLRKGNADDQ
jgi:hypothetical protein